MWRIGFPRFCLTRPCLPSVSTRAGRVFTMRRVLSVVLSCLPLVLRPIFRLRLAVLLSGIYRRSSMSRQRHLSLLRRPRCSSLTRSMQPPSARPASLSIRRVLCRFSSAPWRLLRLAYLLLFRQAARLRSPCQLCVVSARLWRIFLLHFRSSSPRRIGTLPPLPVRT